MDISKPKNNSSTRKPLENYAFIDGQNLYKGVENLDWELDYYRLRHYLRAKFGVLKAFIFLGYIAKYKKLYEYLEECGFEIVFKEIDYNKEGTKGNVDVDLTLNVMKYIDDYKKAILITSDGDFASLIKELKLHNKFNLVIAPEEKKCSRLLKREVGGRIVYLDEFALKVCKMKKRPADR